MKWKNKGHEFDEFVDIIPADFHKRVYIFGAGILGKSTGMCLDILGLLGGFIDNGTERYGNFLLDKPIVSFEEYLSYNDEFNDKILPVIATYFFGKTYMRLAQISLTEMCSLK